VNEPLGRYPWRRHCGTVSMHRGRRRCGLIGPYMSRQVFPQAPSPTMTSLRRISAICANVLMTLQTVCRCSSRRCAWGRATAAGDGVVLWWWRSDVGKGGKLRRVVEGSVGGLLPSLRAVFALATAPQNSTRWSCLDRLLYCRYWEATEVAVCDSEC